MPNGGSDCCMTCWFNPGAKYPPAEDFKDKSSEEILALLESVPKPSDSYCKIRHFPVKDAAYTYWLNSNRHSYKQSPIPVGPVFEFSGDYQTNERHISIKCPDTPEIRDNLLEIANDMIGRPGDLDHVLRNVQTIRCCLPVGAVSRREGKTILGIHGQNESKQRRTAGRLQIRRCQKHPTCR